MVTSAFPVMPAMGGVDLQILTFPPRHPGHSSFILPAIEAATASSSFLGLDISSATMEWRMA